MALDAKLIAMLRCPESGGELHLFDSAVEAGVEAGEKTSFLLCAESRLRYPINEQGIPVLLVSEAERLEPEQLDALLSTIGKGS